MNKFFQFIKFLRTKSNKFLYLTLILCVSCQKPNKENFEFWNSYHKFQTTLKDTTHNQYYLFALNGVISKEKLSDFKLDQNGNPFLELGGIFKNEQWILTWYPEKNTKYDYYNIVTFVPVNWDSKPIYQVQRQLTSNWNGFQPRHFFFWLNEFLLNLNDKNHYENLKNQIPSFKFLCETFACEFVTEGNYKILKFSFTENTKDKFPDFYKRFGSRLEKTNLIMKIFDKHFPEDVIFISNEKTTIKIQFKNQPRNAFFKHPKDIEIISNIKISSYGLQYEILGLKYNLNLKSMGNKDVLSGKFINFESRKLTGNFLYFIPTGIIDFFIPGNIDEYLSNALTLLVYGTQGKGGAQFKAEYEKFPNYQRNRITSYSEIMQSRFSLFGADSNTKENSKSDFFLQWEHAILKDLSGLN